jgi:hypothetical protein
MAYIFLGVRFTCFVRLLYLIFKKKNTGKYFRSTNSATGATLDTGDGLNLTRQGLAPCKMHQALLDALTPPATAGVNWLLFCAFFAKKKTVYGGQIDWPC